MILTISKIALYRISTKQMLNKVSDKSHSNLVLIPAQFDIKTFPVALIKDKDGYHYARDLVRDVGYETKIECLRNTTIIGIV